ncbi:glycosyltransferase [Neorhizobium sp. DT-125]|uniref:glycosyltransferase n=1 Tax=Neorhizobium sp. DT-125 TaxID=3396163 RepID=UPI003F1BCE57
MRKRIVFHVPSLRGGGAERVFVLMANEMAVRGHAVTLFVWNAEGPNAELIGPQVNLVTLGLAIHGEGFGKSATLKGLARSAAFLRREQPNAVFSAPEFANLLTTLALLFGGCRAAFFPSYHAAASLESNGLGSRIAPILTRLIAWRATRAIAVSSGIGRDLSARGFHDDQVAVIHNPLPPLHQRNAAPHAWQAALAAMGEGPVVVTLGRLVPVKDHRTLLKAFSILDPAQRCRLVIFGDGPLKENLVAYAGELGISERVLFPGYVNDPAVCYAIADLFVLSSTSEGFGNVLIEAMAAGIPVVSTDAPHGPREILADGRFGALVPVGDAAALAEAIGKTLAEPPQVPELKMRAADFSIGVIGDRYETLIGKGI